MRIIQWNSAKCLGGAEYRTLELTEALLKDGDEVLVVCRKGTILESKIKQKQFNFISFRYSFLGFFKILFNLIKWKPQIIHVHSGKDYTYAVLI